jgi:host factor-I protein
MSDTTIAATRKPRRAKRTTAQPAEERFLAESMNEGKTVEIYLTNGTRIEGKIVSFDPHVVLLQGETTDKVYKTAISTIQEAKKKSAARSRPAPQAARADGATRKPAVVVVKRVRRAPVR